MQENYQKQLLRQLPAVDELMKEAKIQILLEEYSRPLVVRTVQSTLAQYRKLILTSNCKNTLENCLPSWFSEREVVRPAIAGEVVKSLHSTIKPGLRKIINATGVILHTNLGRALLSEKAQKAVKEAASSYTNLELDLGTGRRGSRYDSLERLLIALTEAEAALVVNNNAAAVLLALSTLAKEREVIVSRGQLVEIGGSFRIPEVMAQSGARLVEVGTTNKTYPDDYRRAISDKTALLLHVHTSNYRIVGFTREVSISELVKVGKEYSLPVMSDLGSGSLIDLTSFGLPPEPTVQSALSAGSDVVTFSGDKLLGGPQAGIIIGRSELLQLMKKNPLTRALRIDKFTVAALEATLREYLNPEQAVLKIPTLQMLVTSPSDLKKRAEQLAKQLKKAIGKGVDIAIENSCSQVGGGAMPTAELPTVVVAVKPKDISLATFQARLRNGNIPVLGHVTDDKLLLDVRTLQKEDTPLLVEAISMALEGERCNF